MASRSPPDGLRRDLLAPACLEERLTDTRVSRPCRRLGPCSPQRDRTPSPGFRTTGSVLMSGCRQHRPSQNWSSVLSAGAGGQTEANVEVCAFGHKMAQMNEHHRLGGRKGIGDSTVLVLLRVRYSMVMLVHHVCVLSDMMLSMEKCLDRKETHDSDTFLFACRLRRETIRDSNIRGFHEIFLT